MPRSVLLRRAQVSPYQTIIQEELDNPFFHGVFWNIITSKAVIKKNYEITLEIWNEHRGFSRGLTSKEELVIFPRINFSAKDSIEIGQETFPFQLQVGNLYNFKFNGDC